MNAHPMPAGSISSRLVPGPLAALAWLGLLTAGCDPSADPPSAAHASPPSADTKSADTKSADTKSADTKSAGGTSADQQPADTTSTGAKGTHSIQIATPRSMTLVTSWPGASVEEVAVAVTAPLEESLLGMAGVATVASISRFQQSQIMLTLTPQANPNDVRQAIAARLRQATNRLPSEAAPPRLTNIPFDAIPGIWLVLTAADPTSEPVVRAAQQVRQQLERVPHVAAIRVLDAVRREVRVACDPAKLAAHGLTLSSCVEGAKAAAQASSPEEMANAIITASAGQVVRLGDVATIRQQAEPAQSLAWLDGRPVVALGVLVDGENPRGVRRAIEQQLEPMRHLLPEGASLDFYDPPPNANTPAILAQWWLPAEVEAEHRERLVAQITQVASDEGIAEPVLAWWQQDEGAVRLLAWPRQDAKKLVAAWRSTRPTGAAFVATSATPDSVPWRLRYPVQLVLLGPEREVLERWAAQVVERLQQIAIDAHSLGGAPLHEVTHLQFDRSRMNELSVKPAALSQVLQAASAGIVVTPEDANDRNHPFSKVRVVLDVDQTQLANVPVPAAGKWVPLSAVARITRVAQPMAVYRLGGRRAIVIVGNQPDASDTERAAAITKAKDAAENIKRQMHLAGEYEVHEME